MTDNNHVGKRVVEALDHICNRANGVDFAAIGVDRVTGDAMERVYVLVTRNPELCAKLETDATITQADLRLPGLRECLIGVRRLLGCAAVAVAAAAARRRRRGDTSMPYERWRHECKLAVNDINEILSLMK